MNTRKRPSVMKQNTPRACAHVARSAPGQRRRAVVPSPMKPSDACQLVRETTARVASQATRCVIDDERVTRVVDGMSPETIEKLLGPREFDADGMHFCDPDDPDLTARYLLAVDAINFCFWPDHDAIGGTKKKDGKKNEGVESCGGGGGGGGGDDVGAGGSVADAGDAAAPSLATQGLEYEHVAGGLKRAVEDDRGVLDADRLARVDGPTLRAMLGWPRPLPLEEERARLLREVGAGLAAHYGGSAAALIRAAGGSAPMLVDLVVRAFPGFRDAVVDPREGRQVFLYKRAQIFVGDVWGRFEGKGLGAFGDSIGQLTMFADYRVPVVLRDMGVLRYDDALAATVDGGAAVIPAGSAEEIEIRACTVQAVERIKTALSTRLVRDPALAALAAAAGARVGGDGGDGGDDGPGGSSSSSLTSVAIDWFLWTEGEKMRDDSPPHHRTLTVYY